MSIYVIIPAGGTSSRYSKEKSKLKETIRNKNILMHTIDAFHSNDQINKIIIAHPSSDKDWFKEIAFKYEKVILITGGKSRAESVQNAFNIIPTDCNQIMIHDAARPNVSHQLINTIVSAGNHHNAVIPGVKVTDTLKEVRDSSVIKTVNRESLITVQTPQLFSYLLLKACYEKIADISLFTDEASLIEAINEPIHVITGDPSNIKITHPIDLKLLELLMSNH